MKRSHIFGITIALLVMTGCSSTPSTVETRVQSDSKMTTNDPCVTHKASCTPAQAEASAAQYAALERRIMIQEERLHQAEVRETDNRITDNARMSDLGK